LNTEGEIKGTDDQRLADGASWMHAHEWNLMNKIFDIADPVHDVDALPLEAEDFDDEVHVADMKRIVKIAIDSGAGSHVMSPVDLEGYALEPSPASIRGKGFIAANGGRIDNLGQCHVRMGQRGDHGMKTTVQVAEVSRPLMSVSQICDAHTDNRVVFTAAEGLVMRGDQVLARYPRSGGLYVAEMELDSVGGARPAGFPGQGTKR